MTMKELTMFRARTVQTEGKFCALLQKAPLSWEEEAQCGWAKEKDGTAVTWPCVEAEEGSLIPSQEETENMNKFRNYFKQN